MVKRSCLNGGVKAPPLAIASALRGFIVYPSASDGSLCGWVKKPKERQKVTFFYIWGKV